MSDLRSVHEKAQRLSAEAAVLERQRTGHARALALFREAADLEGQAFAEAPVDKPRTRSLLAISYVSLLLKADALDHAARAAAAILADPKFPASTHAEMKTLLEAVWEEQTVKAAGLKYSGEEVELKLRGGQVGSGTAPVDVALHFLSVSNNYAIRLAEWSAQKPFRPRGPAGREIVGSMVARATQPAASSYKFSIRFMEPRQRDLFGTDSVAASFDPAKTARTFVDLARAVAVGDVERIREMVPDKDYRLALVKLTRNMLPSRSANATLEVRRLGDSPLQTVQLHSEQRKAATEVVRELSPLPPKDSSVRVIRGVLRALDLDRKWLRIDPAKGPGIRCLASPEVALDDVIGPMVNRRVIAHVTEGGRGIVLRDVELDE